MVAALAVLQLWRGDELGADGTTPAMILGIRPYLVRDLTIDPVAVTVAALGVLAVVALAACRRASRATTVLGAAGARAAAARRWATDTARTSTAT